MKKTLDRKIAALSKELAAVQAAATAAKALTPARRAARLLAAGPAAVRKATRAEHQAALSILERFALADGAPSADRLYSALAICLLEAAEGARRSSWPWPMPPASALKNAAHRQELLSVLDGLGDDAPLYFAESLISERHSTDARLAAARRLLTRAGTAEGGLRFLVAAWSRVKEPRTATAVHASLQAILEALVTAFANGAAQPGESPARQLAALIDAGWPEQRVPAAVAGSTADRALRLFVDLLSAAPASALVPEQFVPLRVLRRRLAEHWNAVSQRAGFTRARAWVLFAIECEARAGRTSPEFRDYLSLSTTDPVESEAAVAAIADRNPSVVPEVLAWLRGRAYIAAGADVVESRWRAADSVLAELLIEAEALHAAGGVLRDQARGELAVLSPSLAAPLERHVGGLEAAVERIRDLARLRNLSVLGTPGDVVEFVPGLHKLLDPDRSGRPSRVSIVVPAVVVLEGQEISRVVRPAAVELPNGGEG